MKSNAFDPLTAPIVTSADREAALAKAAGSEQPKELPEHIVRSLDELNGEAGIAEDDIAPDEAASPEETESERNYRAFIEGMAEHIKEEPLKGRPAHPAIDGAALLLAVHDFLGRFVSYPSKHHHVAHVLWIFHTHLMGAWESTPRLAFLSPEPASGKSRALEATELLVPRPVEAVNVTPAYLFRKVADKDGAPTILFDEIDTVFGPKAKENEEIRGLLNAGHRRGAVAGRCVVLGSKVVTEEIPAYCAVAMAGLGGLPETLLSRAVIMPMRRRAPDETVEPFRRRIHAPEGEALRLLIDAWTDEVGHAATEARPVMPAGINDRDADIWEPLLAVADLAGGNWPELARVSAVTLVTLSKVAVPSLGIRLLADVKAVFGDEDQMSTVDILAGLHGMEESPWLDLKGKPLNDRGLANRLGKYGIKSKTVRVRKKSQPTMQSYTAKGYERTDLHDVWQRYLPKPLLDVGTPTNGEVTTVTSVTSEPLL